MKDQKGNVAPGQQNYPSENEPQGNPDRRSPDEIVEGARQEDQLDKLNKNAPEGDEGKQNGAEPKAYQYQRQDKGGDEQ